MMINPNALATDDVPEGCEPPTEEDQLLYLADHGRFDVD